MTLKEPALYYSICTKIREEGGCWIVDYFEYQAWLEQKKIPFFPYDQENTLVYDLTPREMHYTFVLRRVRQ